MADMSALLLSRGINPRDARLQDAVDLWERKDQLLPFAGGT